MVGDHLIVRREMMSDLMMDVRQDEKMGVRLKDGHCLGVLKMIDRYLVDRYVLSFFSPIENYVSPI
jgi:hypothetical protein